MSTKVRKVVKKAAKATARKKVVVKKAKRLIASSRVSEVFSTEPKPKREVEVPKGAVLLFVNGNSKGTVDTDGQNVGAFVVSQAQRYGVRSFSVYLDGVKANTGVASRSMSGFSKVEIVAKDSRA